MPSDERTHIAINPVLANRVEDFEEWLRHVVVPAIDRHRPELTGRWRVLRATEPDDGVIVYTFVAQGGTLDEWELEPILRDALGQDGADRELSAFSQMLKEEQRGWSFAPLHLSRP
jgi:hypothetical protein